MHRQPSAEATGAGTRWRRRQLTETLRDTWCSRRSPMPWPRTPPATARLPAQICLRALRLAPHRRMTSIMAFRDVTTRGRTRICFSYGLAPRIPVTVPGKRISEAYDFGRIASHMDLAGDLLPRVVIDEELPPADPDCSQPAALPSFPPMYSARALLTMTPRGDAVLVIDGDLIKPVTPEVMAKVLAETCFQREDIQINGLPIMAWLRARLEEIGVRTDDLKFGNDVHQCVFPGGALQDRFHAQDTVSVNHAAAELLYRGTVPVGDTESLLHIYLPPGLNNSANTFAAHGRGVSIFSGWAPNLENSFILTAISPAR